MSVSFEECKIVDSREIKLGAAIIVSDYEQPCGRLVAIVTGVDSGKVFSKYLNADPELDSYVKRGVTSILGIATPIGDFGVQLQIDQEGRYRCVQVRESEAKYRDGKPRQWQERTGPYVYSSRRTVAALLD